MDPHITRAAFRIAFYVIMVSGVMLIFLRPGTAEFVVAAMSLMIGVFFATVIGGLVFLTTRIGRPQTTAHTIQQPLSLRDDDEQ